MTTRPLAAVSVVIPVHNGEMWLPQVLDAVLAQANGRDLEIIAVEDGSRDRSREILERYVRFRRVVVIDGPQRGAAAALNAGIRRASHPIVCQIDQDVIIGPGYLDTLRTALEDPTVAAAQGYYQTPNDASIWARVMGLDLEARYRTMLTRDVNHVCTGNTAYRVSALVEAGLFDESLGYGYDNDISYRLVAAGHRLVICADARSTHRWRDGAWSYLVQQYGFGYGRIDLVAKHRSRVGGDNISRLSMMLHAPMTMLALGLFALAGALGVLGWPTSAVTTAAVALLGILAIERFIVGAHAAIAFGNVAGFWFAPVHFARDLAWSFAILVWMARRVRGIAPRPSHSMRPRPVVDRLDTQNTR
jgi:cellulose synthase/poly-beta-1,6-N-acetylglucosamine synthase-like glycosyltransferase